MPSDISSSFAKGIYSFVKQSRTEQQNLTVYFTVMLYIVEPELIVLFGRGLIVLFDGGK